MREVVAQTGEPLSPEISTEMGQRIGFDFSQARIHSDERASASARLLGARAYTVGDNVVFGRGEFAPRTPRGRRLLAHELVHVAQQSRAPSGLPEAPELSYPGSAYEREADQLADRSLAPGPQRQVVRSRTPALLIQRQSYCSATQDEETVVASHDVSPDTIQAPGDEVHISVRFACRVRDFFSRLETASGDLVRRWHPDDTSTDSYETSWDGRRQYENIDTLVSEDGDYHHVLETVKYAYRYNPETELADDVFATGDALRSPAIHVRVRAGAGAASHDSAENIEAAAIMVTSEIGVGEEAEQRAVAWAIRNQMLRLNTSSATDAQEHFDVAHDEAATEESRALAAEILAEPIENDPTHGAIKWFSPRSQPSGDEPPAARGCHDVIEVTDTAGDTRRVWAPRFHWDMVYVPVDGVREWYLRLYRLP